MVVPLEKFVELDNCDNVKAAIIFGNSVIVSKDAKELDLGVFFPLETSLSHSFLSNNNLYRKPEYGNIDPEKTGFFEQHGRVKAAKFRGHKSEGFWVPLSFFSYLGVQPYDFSVGDEFDEIGGIQICEKFIPKGLSEERKKHIQGRKARLEDRIMDGQFRFHVDTENLRRNIHKINPGDVISISEKWHGCQVTIGNLLINKQLKWYEKAAKWLGVAVKEQDYGLVWSSRRVVKGVNGESKADSIHYYESDVWGEVANEVKDRIPPGFTLYGEIVGFTEGGSPVQPGYHYGCRPGTHRFLVYRVTFTTQDGHQIELGWPQIQEFCKKFNLEMVPTLFYGKAGVLEEKYTTTDIRDWRDNLLKYLESQYVYDQQCQHNNFEVPAEGIVVRIEHLDQCESYKLKSFKFLKRESDILDKGEIDMETQESLG